MLVCSPAPVNQAGHRAPDRTVPAGLGLLGRIRWDKLTLPGLVWKCHNPNYCTKSYDQFDRNSGTICGKPEGVNGDPREVSESSQ